MFGKIKDRLKDVFSKTDEIIEEENLENEENTEEQLNTIEEQTAEIDELEQEIEDELDEAEEDIKEEEKELREDEHSDEESIEEEIKEEVDDIKEIDKLEEKLEQEIEEVEDEIEENDISKTSNEENETLEINSENVESNDDNEETPEVEEKTTDDGENELEEEKSQKKGFFSRIWGKKESDEESETDNEVEEEKSPEIEKNNEEKISNDEENKLEEIEEEKKEENSEGFLQSSISSLTQKKMSQDNFTALWVELELFLLEINIAFEIVEKIEKKLKNEIVGNKFSRFSLKEKTKEVLIDEISSVMHTREANFKEIIQEYLEEEKPLPIMMLGVNGTGKTTTIGKLISYFQKNDLSVVVAAADTFRAAAVEQVKQHCDNLNVKCVAHKQGADPAAVCYDAIEHAKAKKIDIVLIDTAGRMPNNKNLMEELKKIKRVSNTKEVIFIGDSISGNDLIEQINLFDEGLGVTGVILTKVDTDERPGSVVTTAYSINTPIYFLGYGQTYDDLAEFKAQEIAEKLFDEE